MIIQTIKTKGLTLDKIRYLLGDSARFIGYRYSERTLNSYKRYRKYRNISKYK
jgi:hypothetical protein